MLQRLRVYKEDHPTYSFGGNDNGALTLHRAHCEAFLANTKSLNPRKKPGIGDRTLPPPDGRQPRHLLEMTVASRS